MTTAWTCTCCGKWQADVWLNGGPACDLCRRLCRDQDECQLLKAAATSSPSPCLPRVIYAGSLYVTVNRQHLAELLRWVAFAEKLLAKLGFESRVGVRVCHR